MFFIPCDNRKTFFFYREGSTVLPLKKYSPPSSIEAISFKLNLRSKKWLLRCSYNPHKSLIKEHLNKLIKTMQFYSKTYENLMLIGNHNAKIDETNMAFFCEVYLLRSLINEPTEFIMHNHFRHFGNWSFRFP